MANFARLIAMGGALAGGYMQGKKMQEDAEWEKEKRQQERDAMQREADVRQASASTLGAVGTQTGASASGDEALAAGNQALTAALAQAKTPEEAATIKANFEPTMAALVAQQGAPAQSGSTYTQDQAQADYVKKMYQIDPNKAQQTEATQLQIDEGRDKADKRKRFKAADADLRAWGDKHAVKDADGNPVVNDDSFASMGKMRSILMAKHGLYDEAMQNADQTMQYVARKVQSESVVRAAETDKALRAFDAGQYEAAMKVYDMVPDGSKAVGVKVGKGGEVTVSRVSALDGAKLPDVKFKDLPSLRASIEGIKDPNAVINHVERTFKHDIESRKVAADETRAGAAAKGADLAEKKDDRETKKLDAVSKGLADYADAEAKGDAKGMASARRTILASGGKLDKPEAEAGKFVPNTTMGGGNVVHTGKGGAVTVTPVPMNAEGAITVAPPGAAKAAPPTQADLEATAKKYGITVDEVKKRLGMK